jgi:hypothetical protein
MLVAPGMGEDGVSMGSNGIHAFGPSSVQPEPEPLGSHALFAR